MGVEIKTIIGSKMLDAPTPQLQLLLPRICLLLSLLLILLIVLLLMILPILLLILPLLLSLITNWVHQTRYNTCLYKISDAAIAGLQTEVVKAKSDGEADWRVDIPQAHTVGWVASRV